MYTHTRIHTYRGRYRCTQSGTDTHTCNPSQPRTVWHTVYTIRMLHAIGDGTLWCTTCNRWRFVYEYDSSLITGDVTGAHKFSSFVNVLYIRFAIVCTNTKGGDHPRFLNVPGLIVVVSHLRPRLEVITNTNTHTHLTQTLTFAFIVHTWVTQGTNLAPSLGTWQTHTHTSNTHTHICNCFCFCFYCTYTRLHKLGTSIGTWHEWHPGIASKEQRSGLLQQVTETKHHRNSPHETFTTTYHIPTNKKY